MMGKSWLAGMIGLWMAAFGAFGIWVTAVKRFPIPLRLPFFADRAVILDRLLHHSLVVEHHMEQLPVEGQVGDEGVTPK